MMSQKCFWNVSTNAKACTGPRLNHTPNEIHRAQKRSYPDPWGVEVPLGLEAMLHTTQLVLFLFP